MGSNEIIGIIPAGGFGTRMHPYKMWKELIPIGYKEIYSEDCICRIPKAISEYTIENMKYGAADRIIFVINSHKNELIRYFGDGNEYGIDMAYVCQEPKKKLTGMPVAIDTAYKWIKENTVYMGMPDTIIKPEQSFKSLYEMHTKNNADLTIGVFPTNNPKDLAPVVINKLTNRVEKIYDKPKESEIYNTWNIAVWEPSFTELLHQYINDLDKNDTQGKEVLLSDIFNKAINNGLKVFGLFFKDGQCLDLGKFCDIERTKNCLENFEVGALSKG